MVNDWVAFVLSKVLSLSARVMYQHSPLDAILLYAMLERDHRLTGASLAREVWEAAT